MSHYSVLAVLGQIPLESVFVERALSMALAPYDENLAVPGDWEPLDDRYVAAAAAIAATQGVELSVEHVVEATWGSAKVRLYEGEWQLQSMYNPNSKWDWWQWGGRWSGFLPTKPGCTGLLGDRSWANRDVEYPEGRCDACMVKDLDLEGARLSARLEAESAFERVSAAVAGLRRPEPWRSRLERVRGDSSAIQCEREVYRSDPYVSALRESNCFSFFDDPVEVMMRRPTQADWVRHATSQVLTTFAVLMEDGSWVEHGEMGWFGFSEDKYTDDEWSEVFWEKVSQLHPETVVAVVDCHI